MWAARRRPVELVTADGQIRRVDADHYPDLFWALRGGKGNFGIVTAIEFELVPVARLYGGGIYFPGAAGRSAQLPIVDSCADLSCCDAPIA